MLKMPVHASAVALGSFWFIIWTALSFYAHFFARKTLQNDGSEVSGEQNVQDWYNVLMVTLVQTLVGVIALSTVTYFLQRGYLQRFIGHHSENGKSHGHVQSTELTAPSLSALLIAHAGATLTTNASIAFVNTGSAFTIKAFEPISSAVLTSMLLGTKLQTHVIVSLPLVVSGAVGFVWQPSYTSVAVFGLVMAFASNIFFGIRNINMKLFNHEEDTVIAKLGLLQKASFASVLLLSPITLGMAHFANVTSRDFNLIASIVSGCFHVSYTIISICVILKYMSVVGHATSNLLKRIIMAIAFFAIGKETIATHNWLMGLVMLVGVVIYVAPQLIPFKDASGSICLTIIILVVVLLGALTQSPHVQESEKHNSVILPALNLNQNLLKRQNQLQQTGADLQQLVSFKSYEKPEFANRLSIQATSSNDLIVEAYRLHQEIFTYILGKYKRAILVNVFQWFNKGDHLITIGQRKILERMDIQLIYHCYYPGNTCNFTNVPQNDAELVVLVQGAGYIGHPAHEFILTTTIDHFPQNRVMIFPISVCHPTPPCTEIFQFSQIFAKHKDIHIVLRDRYSYDLAQQYFKTTKNYLAPDSAFAVGSIRMNIVPVYDIIWLKRDDWESQGDTMPNLPTHLKVQVKDWDDDWMKSSSEDFWEDHQLRTMSGITFLARAKVIISDRLHAHIMSQLMGKLNVVINSRTKKQEHYYMTWEQNVKTSALVNSNSEALTEALRLLAMYNQTLKIV